MKKNNFEYILRYAVDPKHQAECKIEELIDFCKVARIDDVMFFIGCEELNRGHITFEEASEWLDLIRNAKNRLSEIGVTTSINPWASLLHADRGRTLRGGQKFNLMVDPKGNRATAQVCPLCSEWRRYITELYSMYAGVEPYMIWVEDDFRLHNHSPLQWGGCFCEKHMELFSERAGKHLTREELVEKLLAPGEPHPFREIWLDTCRDTMVELADMIGAAVHRVSPLTRVGLMSSNPAVHSAEGRDWEGILRGLSGEMPMVNRPHLPAYSEETPHGYLWYFNTVSRLSRLFVPGDTEIYPELDNFPHSRFSKSHTFTLHQIESSLLLDSKGITLNIFDMIGNGVNKNQAYDLLLESNKDFLSAVKALGLITQRQKGVKVLVSPLSSYTLQTYIGKGMEELYPAETFWAGLLSAFGISNAYTIDKNIKDEIIAVSGQYFRNLNEGEIRRIFDSNFVLMDGEAAFTLYDMGLGTLAGITDAKWHLQDTAFQSYEEVCGGREFCGMKAARISAQNTAGDFLEITYDDNVEKITQAKSPSGNTIATGMAVYDNRIVILPYGRFNDRVQAHLNPVRQSILHYIIREHAKKGNVAYIKDKPYMQLYYYQLDDINVLGFVNSTCDVVEGITVFFQQNITEKVFLIEKTNPVPHIIPTSRCGDDMTLPLRFDGMEMKFVYWKTEE